MVTFVSENDPGGGLAVDPAYVAGNFWDDIDVTIYMATTATPTGTPGIIG